MATDLAFCPRCNDAFKPSESIDRDAVTADILHDPPRGAWFRDDIDKMIVGASTRTPFACFIIPFTCVWAGGSMTAIYGSQIANGEFDLVASLFGIPFLIGSIILVTVSAMSVCGKVEVSIGSDSAVFVGVGPLGWTRRFDWDAVQAIKDAPMPMPMPGGFFGGILLDGHHRLKFGSNLNEKRRHFVLNALKYLKSESR
ncbi:MAG: hypothetical protein CMJ49_08850 [Planctomycetaceae bacterium]|nr:hypothetical protein [Planctomycetaceae bacterium]